MPDNGVATHFLPSRADRRPRIAIVSTYDEMCGIAGYTRALERQLSLHADVTVFDLDQYLLRSPHRRIQRLADAHIKEIAAALHEFDSVNIQLEHGTLGRSMQQIARRFRRLAKAAPALSVTFHTVLLGEDIPWETLWRLVTRAKFQSAGRVWSDVCRGRILGFGIQGLLRRLQRRKPVSVIVHTKRDMRMMQDLFGIQRVFHHPLSFIAPSEARLLRARTSRADFPLLARVPPQAKLIGTFGFLSPYKGFDTAIRAMKLMPEDHHLLIFGGIHPQVIKREERIAPYLQNLLSTAHIGQTPLDQLKESGLRIAPSAGELSDLLAEHPHSLFERVHFMGALPDEQFYAAIALCDVAVFPYLEVGQASSGPISIAVEMGTRVIASRTAAFRAFAKYHPGIVEFFDIGNFAELATRIQGRGPKVASVPDLQFDTQSNVQLYLKANGIAAAELESVACAAE